jgi:hypothetical protein
MAKRRCSTLRNIESAPLGSVLVVDVGGTRVKVKCGADGRVVKIDSGPGMTAALNARLLRVLPDGVRRGSNADAFTGGILRWHASARTAGAMQSGA